MPSALTISLACSWFHITPAEAIVGATLNAAYVLRRNRDRGSIEVGKDADLVIYDKYPLSDFAKVQKVLIDGNLYFDRDREVTGQAARQAEKQKLLDKEKQNQQRQQPPRRPGA